MMKVASRGFIGACPEALREISGASSKRVAPALPPHGLGKADPSRRMVRPSAGGGGRPPRRGPSPRPGGGTRHPAPGLRHAVPRTLGLVTGDARPLTPHERRLRRALVATSIAAAFMALVVGAVLLYWFRYVLPTEPDPFTRGPYVVAVGTTTATLRWKVEGDRPVEIVATTPDGRTLTSSDGRLRGLEPGARQGWVARVGGRARAAGTITTAPTDARAPIRFVAFGDYGAGGEDEWAVGRVAAAQQPAFTVVPGDNSYLISAPALFDRNIFAPMRALLAQGPFVATLGEHDIAWFGGADVARALGLPNGGDRYTFDYGPLRFIVLGLQADSADVAFVRTALARPGARHTYLVVHRPPAAGNPVLAIARGRVTAVLAGHNHRYERRVIDGVLSLTVGTGGAPRSGDETLTPRSADALSSLAEFGLLRVDDAPGRVTMTFIDAGGRVRDRVVVR